MSGAVFWIYIELWLLKGCTGRLWNNAGRGSPTTAQAEANSNSVVPDRNQQSQICGLAVRGY